MQLDVTGKPVSASPNESLTMTGACDSFVEVYGTIKQHSKMQCWYVRLEKILYVREYFASNTETKTNKDIYTT